jgi:hypothetical protein
MDASHEILGPDRATTYSASAHSFYSRVSAALGARSTVGTILRATVSSEARTRSSAIRFTSDKKSLIVLYSEEGAPRACGRGASHGKIVTEVQRISSTFQCANCIFAASIERQYYLVMPPISALHVQRDRSYSRRQLLANAAIAASRVAAYRLNAESRLR